MHYYGRDVTWREVYDQADAVVASLKVLGFGEGDQIPVFLRAVPEFVYLLLVPCKTEERNALPQYIQDALDPFCDPHDVDLELMRYRPNNWPIIPMFIETVMRNGRTG